MSRTFFDDAVERVSPRLLGKLLVRRTRGGVLAGRIVEVEAYLGPHHETPDRAAHSHRGPTPRNEVMFGPPGHAYVYSIYGRYFCMNITCEPTGRAGCVLIRALEPVTGLAAMAKNRGLALNFLERRDPGLPPLRKEHRKDARGLPLLRQDRRKDGATGDKETATRAAAKEMAALTSGPSRLCQALDITRPAHNGLDLLDARSVLQVRDDGLRPTRAQVTVRIGITHAAELPLRFCLEGHGCVSGPKKMAGSFVDVD
jgi:DNA-3-methyladenine glycosylase